MKYSSNLLSIFVLSLAVSCGSDANLPEDAGGESKGSAKTSSADSDGAKKKEKSSKKSKSKKKSSKTTTAKAPKTANAVVSTKNSKPSKTAKSGGASSTPKTTSPFGAASWLPADASFFSSMLGMQEQWKVFRASGAMKKLLAHPTVQGLLAQLQGSPPFQQFQAVTASDPMAKAAFEVLSDAMSSEIFVYGDKDCAPFANALSELSWKIYFPMELWEPVFRGERPPEFDPERLALTALEFKDQLKIPGLMLGFRLSNVESARTLLGGLMQQLTASGAPIQEADIGGGHFYSAPVSPGMAPPPMFDDMRRELLAEGISEATVGKLQSWLRSILVNVSIGIRRDYLLLSLGSGTEHLEALKGAAPLSESPGFAPARGVLKPDLISVSYASKQLNQNEFSAESLQSAIDRILGMLPKESLPKGLKERLKKDSDAFVAEVSKDLGSALSSLSVTFRNQGYETYSFAKASNTNIEATKPLGILSLAGASPLVTFARGGAVLAKPYGQLSRGIAVLYGYYEDFIVPQIPKADLSEVRRFQETFTPLFKALDKTTRESLIPSLEGGQGLLVVDSKGNFGPFLPLPETIGVPRPAVVWEVNDKDRFVSALTGYIDVLNQFIAKASELDPSLDSFEMPPPNSRQTEAGTVFSYGPLGPGLEPHFLVGPKHIVFSIAVDQSQTILSSKKGPNSSEVKLDANSESVLHVDLAQASTWILSAAEFFVWQAVEQRMIDGPTAEMIGAHLPLLREVLGTIRSYSSRTYLEKDLRVTHSHFRVVDSAK
ncbi:MAG: hypothetical protein AAF517_06215 [Planctomycetota bacterium]